MSERLAVLLSGEVVGHLERAGPGSDPVFAYTADYVRSGAVALSAALPISAARHSGKRLGAYLAGLLPESDAARAAWAGRLGVAADDVFGTLGQMGWDCAGAVQFCREGQLDELRSRAAEFEPIGEAEIAARLRGLADGEASWTLPGEHWSLGGQQQKLALARVEGRWHAAHGSAPTTHIIKPGIARLHHQALVEHATMAAAASVGVVAAPTAFERFEDQWAIVVRRFDREVLGDRVIRVHQEDFAQACGLMPEQKYEAHGGPGLGDMMRVVERVSTAVADDSLALADFALVNLVAGAPDGHAKNASLLHGPGVTAVAPLYDLATGLAYDARDVDRNLALSIGGERAWSRIRRRQFEKAAGVLRLDPGLLTARALAMAQGFPAAFEAALRALPPAAPGADEVAERAVSALAAHAQRLLEQLAR